MYSSSKGTSEDRPLDAATARTGPALAAATTAPEATRIIVLVLRSPRPLRALCLSPTSWRPSSKSSSPTPGVSQTSRTRGRPNLGTQID